MLPAQPPQGKVLYACALGLRLHAHQIPTLAQGISAIQDGNSDSL
jgi:hypothetical protein